MCQLALRSITITILHSLFYPRLVTGTQHIDLDDEKKEILYDYLSVQMLCGGLQNLNFTLHVPKKRIHQEIVKNCFKFCPSLFFIRRHSY